MPWIWIQCPVGTYSSGGFAQAQLSLLIISIHLKKAILSWRGKCIGCRVKVIRPLNLFCHKRDSLESGYKWWAFVHFPQSLPGSCHVPPWQSPLPECGDRRDEPANTRVFGKVGQSVSRSVDTTLRVLTTLHVADSKDGGGEGGICPASSSCWISYPQTKQTWGGRAIHPWQLHARHR